MKQVVVGTASIASSLHLSTGASWSQRARITGDAAISLSQYGTVAPVTIFQRTDFASSMIDGGTVPIRAAQQVKLPAELWIRIYALTQNIVLFTIRMHVDTYKRINVEDNM